MVDRGHQEMKTRRGNYYQRKKRLENSNQRIINVEFKPKKGQQKIINACVTHWKTKSVIINIFRQYGKSFVMRYVVLKYLSEENVTIGYLTPTNRLGKEFYQKMLEIIPSSLIKQKNGTDLQITLVNNARILFFSIESINTVRGFTLTYLIWDEVAHSREYLPDGSHVYYNVLAPLLDARGRKLILISTPNGAQGFFYEKYLEAIKDPERVDIEYIEVKCTDDETKTPEWIEEKKKSMPALQFQQEYMCQFLENGASYFTSYVKHFSEEIYNWNCKLWVGVDFSSVGDDETIVTFENEYGQVWQEKIMGELDEKYMKMASILNKQVKNIQYCYFESNSIGEPMANSIKKLLAPSLVRKIDMKYTSNKSKTEYIELLAYDIEQGNLHFMTEDDELKSEFSTFSYSVSKTGKITFGALYGYHDDRIISLALANLCRKEKGNTSKEYIKVFKR